MTVKYSLTENLLTERPDDYTAQTHSAGSLDEEAIIARIMTRGTTLTRTDVVASFNALREVVTEAAAQGYNVNLPLFNIAFSISGVFDGPMDVYDGNRHKLNINITKGVALREAEKSVKLEKITSAAPNPQIQEVKDSVSGVLNSRLTPNGVVELRGYNLRIDGNDPSCGLWFVANDGSETKAAIIIENKPARIIAMIPALAAGNWQVKVVTQYTGSANLLKTPKVFVYQKNLTV